MEIKMQNCEFENEFHKGKIEWHHPISWAWDCGMFLYEAPHSLIMGRKFLYQGESVVETTEELRVRVKNFELRKVVSFGYSGSDIDKH